LSGNFPFLPGEHSPGGVLDGELIPSGAGTALIRAWYGTVRAALGILAFELSLKAV
jgi:hypothetical protein